MQMLSSHCVYDLLNSFKSRLRKNKLFHHFQACRAEAQNRKLIFNTIYDYSISIFLGDLESPRENIHYFFHQHLKNIVIELKKIENLLNDHTRIKK